MKTVIQAKILASKEESKSLLDTMKVFNQACQEIAKVCCKEKLTSQFKIQKLV